MRDPTPLQTEMTPAARGVTRVYVTDSHRSLPGPGQLCLPVHQQFHDRLLELRQVHRFGAVGREPGLIALADLVFRAVAVQGHPLHLAAVGRLLHLPR